MAQLVVRNLEEDVKRWLQARAQRHGRSVEAEVHDILRQAAAEESPQYGLGTAIANRFRGCGFEGEIEELRGFAIRSATFDDIEDEKK